MSGVQKKRQTSNGKLYEKLPTLQLGPRFHRNYKQSFYDLKICDVKDVSYFLRLKSVGRFFQSLVNLYFYLRKLFCFS